MTPGKPARKPDGVLRKGWTTGACAAAAAAAAQRALLTGAFDDHVEIVLPRGERPVFTLSRRQITGRGAIAAVIKDAGDDPDITHGAEIIVEVTPGQPGTGLSFVAGDGVGTVTLPGLPLPVGEPAINPGPRAIINAAVSAVTAAHGGPDDGDRLITISVPGGTALAEKTMNGRLGIIGGISILGTTGIVVPYSCASWIHSIHRGIDVARANNFEHIAAATGSTSEAAVKKLTGLPESALIDMGDFVGGLLKYLRRHPVARLTIAGGFGKLSKLADGHVDLHSSRSEVNMAGLSEMVDGLGGDAELVRRVGQANTALEALELARRSGLPLADRVAVGAREVALAALSGGTEVSVAVFDRQGRLVGHAGL